MTAWLDIQTLAKAIWLTPCQSWVPLATVIFLLDRNFTYAHNLDTRRSSELYNWNGASILQMLPLTTVTLMLMVRAEENNTFHPGRLRPYCSRGTNTDYEVLEGVYNFSEIGSTLEFLTILAFGYLKRRHFTHGLITDWAPTGLWFLPGMLVAACWNHQKITSLFRPHTLYPKQWRASNYSQDRERRKLRFWRNISH